MIVVEEAALMGGWPKLNLRRAIDLQPLLRFAAEHHLLELSLLSHGPYTSSLRLQAFSLESLLYLLALVLQSVNLCFRCDVLDVTIGQVRAFLMRICISPLRVINFVGVHSGDSRKFVSAGLSARKLYLVVLEVGHQLSVLYVTRLVSQVSFHPLLSFWLQRPCFIP